MKTSIFRELTFEAAHRNLAFGARSECARLHGHSYQARVWLDGAVDDRLGWLRDFAEIKMAAAPVLDMLDHRYLNEVAGLNAATLDEVTRWLEDRLRAVVPEVCRCEVEIIGDTRFNPIRHWLVGQGLHAERVAFWFSAAHLLPKLPDGHKCRRLHGHSFRIEILAFESAGLAAHVERLYGRLDHQFLNDMPGLENPTSENLARWIWEALAKESVRPQKVIVQETCTMGCAYTGE